MNKNGFFKKFTLIISIAISVLAFSITRSGQFGNIQLLSEEEYAALSPSEQKKYQEELDIQFKSMSPQEQQALMEDVVSNMFESLSEDEKEEVLKEVARVEAMSEEERNKYLSEIEKEMEASYVSPEIESPEEKEEEKIEKTEEKEEEKISKVKIEKMEKAIKEAIDTINEVSSNIDSFINKIESIDDFSDQVSKWGKKKKLDSWDNGFEWQKLKEKINILREQLDKLKDRDPKTKKYKYLYHLIENEEAYARLYNLSIDINEHEPIIRGKESKPISRKIKKKSKKATRSLLNAFVAELFPEEEESLVDVLKAIFEKYLPTAEKIKKEQEKIAAKARQESGKKIRGGKVKLAGTSDESDYDTYDFDYDEEFYPQQYKSDYNGQKSGSSIEDLPNKEKNEFRKLDESKPTKEKLPKKDRKITSSDDEKLKTDRRVNKLTKEVDRSLDAIFDIIDENEALRDIGQYIDSKVFEERLAKTYIPSIERQFNRINRKLEEFDRRIKEFKPNTKAAYKKDLKSIFEERETEINKLVNDINNVESNISKINALPENMKWAHFKIAPEEDYFEKAKNNLEKAKLEGGENPNAEQKLNIQKAQNSFEKSKKLENLITELKEPVTFKKLNETILKFVKNVKELIKVK